MLIGQNIKNILGGGYNVSEVKYMDRTVWKNSTILTTFNDKEYFYTDSDGYYRCKALSNVYCIGYKSSSVANELYFMNNGKLEKLDAQINDDTSGLKIYKAPASYKGLSILAYQIRFKNIDSRFKQVLISENELSKEQVLNYFKNI